MRNVKKDSVFDYTKKGIYHSPKIEKLGNMIKITKDNNGGSRCDSANNTGVGTGNAKC